MNAWTQFRRRGYGVIFTAITVLVLASTVIKNTELILNLVGSRCGTGTIIAGQQLHLAEWLFPVPLIGWWIARRSRYGERVALLLCVALVAIFAICFIARKL